MHFPDLLFVWTNSLGQNKHFIGTNEQNEVDSENLLFVWTNNKYGHYFIGTNEQNWGTEQTAANQWICSKKVICMDKSGGLLFLSGQMNK